MVNTRIEPGTHASDHCFEVFRHAGTGQWLVVEHLHLTGGRLITAAANQATAHRAVIAGRTHHDLNQHPVTGRPPRQRPVDQA